MSGTDGNGRRRPFGVTVVVVVTVLSAVFDEVFGVLALVAVARGQTFQTITDDPETLGYAGWALVVIGLVNVALAVALARGVNIARLLVTLVAVTRFGLGLLLVSQYGAEEVQGLLAVVVTLATLYLLWNHSASEFFEKGGEHGIADSLTGGQTLTGRRSLGQLVVDYLLRLVVLAATVALTPQTTATSGWALLVAAVVLWLVARVLNPILLRVAGLFGWFGSLALALFANAAVIGVAFAITPGISVGSVPAAIVASWVYALVMTVVSWALSINTQDYLIVHATRMSLRGRRPEQSSSPGVVFVQLDGMPAPLLENEVRAGNLPTISRWIRSGSHTWTEWVARIPSTTPASQAGILHGDNTGIPAFRFYDREAGRLLVANRPADATVIESRISNGRGLLADGGVSISNLFSGDAPTSLLTMSGLRDRQRGLGPSQSYAAFFTHPAGFVRAVILTVGEMVKEVFQARRQRRRGVEPRIKRSGSYVALRGVTNVFLRDLNVALVAEAMMSGAQSIYVDFVDYDEIAHHAGVTRPESLASLYGMDDVLGSLELLARSAATPRPYHFVLLSDHGQSQGATFRQRYGMTLEELVASHMSTSDLVVASTEDVETWGPVNVFLSQLAGQASMSGRLTKRVLGGREPQDLRHSGAPRSFTADETADRPVVVGSGNLGAVWFSDQPDRVLLEDIEALHPGLVEALVHHPGVGFMVAMTASGPVALGDAGVHQLLTGEITGVDPLAGFGPDAVPDFVRVMRFANAPDIYVNSLYDPVLDEVAAFEELVGCHGGLGGWQTRPILVHPADWHLDADLLDERGRLFGAERVHHQLVRWLERVGQRTELQADAEMPVTH